MGECGENNYWCPVNWYERPYKRRVLGKRIEGVASDGMPWSKNSHYVKCWISSDLFSPWHRSNPLGGG